MPQQFTDLFQDSQISALYANADSRQNTASLKTDSREPNDPVGGAAERKERSLEVMEDRRNSKEC
jgi:hypothetical protein